MPLVSKELLKFSSFGLNPDRLTRLMEESRQLEKSGMVQKYDVFLCHSYDDREVVTILYHMLAENLKLRVYVDWIQNPELDRSQVTTKNAGVIRCALDRSNCLLYAFTISSTQSKWMPWELGYSDALHGRIALLPITEFETNQQKFSGQEYLGLYPYITRDHNTLGEENLYLHDPDDWYVGREISPGMFYKATRGWNLSDLRP